MRTNVKDYKNSQASQRKIHESYAKLETCDRYGHVINAGKSKVAQEMRDLNRIYSKIRSGLN